MLGTSAETVVIPGTSLTVNGKINQSLVNSSSTQLGTNALLNLASEGGSNTCIGVNSGNYTSSGYNNSSLGANSMQGNTTGSNNTCIGFDAMYYYISGKELTPENVRTYSRLEFESLFAFRHMVDPTQELAVRQGYMPGHPDVAPPEGMPRPNQLKILPLDDAKALADDEANKRRFADLFGG
jgi:hypothetical protein